MNPGVSQTPAASLGKPAHTSTPEMDPPGMDERGEAVSSRPSDIPMPTITYHASRRLSHKTSTSSGASADLTVIGQPAETDLYADESHVYGTSQLQQPEIELPSLAFTTEIP